MTVTVTTTVVKVLSALMAQPEPQFGMQLMRETGLASGTLYPILERLLRAEWIEGIDEDIDPHIEGRPRRRYYRLTSFGRASARPTMAYLHALTQPEPHSPGTGPGTP